MNEDPWRLPTEATMRAASRCFRLPTLDVATPLGATEDPETLLERLFGRYLAVADGGPEARRAGVPNAPVRAVAGGETTPLGSTSSPGRALHPLVSGAAALPGGWKDGSVDGLDGRPLVSGTAGMPDGRWGGSVSGVVGQPQAAEWWDGSAGGVVGQSQAVERWDGSVGGVVGQPQATGWWDGSVGGVAGQSQADGPVRGVAPQSSASEAAGLPDGRQSTSARAAARQTSALDAPHSRADARPRLSTGNANQGSDLAAAASGPSDTRDHPGGGAGLLPAEPTPARHTPELGSSSPTSVSPPPWPATSVTRLGRGAPQLAAVLRADAEVAPVNQPHNETPPRGAPIDDLVATFTEEVAGRLRDELEWEFQRTYGMGG